MRWGPWLVAVFKWSPGAMVALYLVVLASTGGLLEEIYSNADAAAAPVIAEELADDMAGRTVTLGDYAWLEALWLLRATSWIPGHYLMWMLIPFAIWLATAALVYALVRAVSNSPSSRQPALVAVALVVCGGAAMRGAFWTPNAHSLAVLHMLVLALALAWFTRDPARAGSVRGAAVAAAVGVVTGPGATDMLLVLYGIGPLVLAGVVVGMASRDWRVLRAGVIVAVVGAAIGAVLTEVGQRSGVGATGRLFSFATVEQLGANVALFPAAVAQLVGGSPFGAQVDARSAVAMVAGLIALAGVVVAVWVPCSEVSRVPRRERAADVVWVGQLTFFGAVVVASAAAWMLTDAPVDVYSARYLVAAWVAVCVLVPAVAARYGTGWVVTAGATFVCGAAAVQFQQDPVLASPDAPTAAEATMLEEFAGEHGVTRGYAPYWSAAPITWHTRFGLEVAPVSSCEPGRNCAFGLHVMSSWYVPRDEPTILILDDRIGPPAVLDDTYGDPLATKQVGEMMAYVFDHDIGAELAD